MNSFNLIYEWIVSWLAIIPRWILTLASKHFHGIETTPVEPPSVDLEEEGYCHINEKLLEIRERVQYLHPIRPQAQGAFEYKVPVSKESFIKFTDDSIPSTRKRVFKGEFLNQKTVAIKSIGSKDIQLDKEMNIAKLLEHHENFLVHLFAFNQLNENYIVTECYSDLLSTFLINQSSLSLDVDVRDIFKQICNGVEFMHDSMIAHQNLRAMNIAIFIRGRNTKVKGKLVYKIMNFDEATTEASEDEVKQDIQDLGIILLKVRDFKNKQIKFMNEKSNETWNLHDDNLCIDLISEMTTKNSKLYSIKECKSHPFLWTSSDALRCIVDSAKLLEPGNDRSFHNALMKISRKVVSKDWRGYISQDLLFELDNINRDLYSLGKRKSPHDISFRSDFSVLIKKIRNLV